MKGYVKWCERFTDFNRMSKKSTESGISRVLSQKNPIQIQNNFFEIAQIPGKKSAEKKPQENWPQKRHRNAFEKKF